MEFQAFWEKYLPYLRKYSLAIGVGVVGLIFLSIGLIILFVSSASDEIVFEENSESTKNSSSQTILVDIEGAVVRPGIYTLPYDARIKDVLIQAGGLSDMADREWVAKNLNLAQKLSDASKLYIPLETDNGQEANVSVFGSGMININSASASELETLSGVGPATALKIIQNRPFSQVDELVSKKVISSKVFEQIKDKITLY